MWEIEWTKEFKNWVFEQDENTREVILTHLILLKEKGPSLSRPFADTVKGSKLNNLKELRVQTKLKVIRIFFVFTKKRIGLLLAGEDKKGNKRFYDEMIPYVESIYSKWLKVNKENV